MLIIVFNIYLYIFLLKYIISQYKSQIFNLFSGKNAYLTEKILKKSNSSILL